MGPAGQATEAEDVEPAAVTSHTPPSPSRPVMVAASAAGFTNARAMSRLSSEWSPFIWRRIASTMSGEKVVTASRLVEQLRLQEVRGAREGQGGRVLLQQLEHRRVGEAGA